MGGVPPMSAGSHILGSSRIFFCDPDLNWQLVAVQRFLLTLWHLAFSRLLLCVFSFAVLRCFALRSLSTAFTTFVCGFTVLTHILRWFCARSRSGFSFEVHKHLVLSFSLFGCFELVGFLVSLILAIVTTFGVVTSWFSAASPVGIFFLNGRTWFNFGFRFRFELQRPFVARRIVLIFLGFLAYRFLSCLVYGRFGSVGFLAFARLGFLTV